MLKIAPALRIANGHVVDPVHGVDGPADIWVSEGRIIEAPTDRDVRADRSIDARGCVVMAGAIDVHSHIAGSKVNAARLMRPEEARKAAWMKQTQARSGTLGCVPTTFATGYKYAGMGYTFALDAAIAPLAARQAHFEFADTPAIDKAMLVLVGNNQYVMDCIRDHQRERLRGYLAWLLGATRGFGLKAVNPGGVEQWKQGRGTLAQLDEEVSGFGVTPRAILVELARAADELALPHPLHVHGLRLGIPGCAAATLELLQALDGHRLHLAHVQFLSYDGEASKVDSMASGVQALANYLNAHEQVTCDVGQVLFGETTSMTADGPVGEYLHRVTGRKWLSHDVELETGCGVVPIEYSDRNFVHALQWCIGLEWFLMVNDPWKMALSTDHPNGATFWSYPRIIALLMSKNLRDETFKRLPRRAQARSSLLELGREYSLSEIAIVTRAAPARMLGQSDRGHLGPGARADVVVYSRGRDIEKMFELPRWVLKGGRVILEEGALRDVAGGEVLRADLEFDDAVVPHIHAWFDRDSSIQFNNFALREDEAK